MRVSGAAAGAAIAARPSHRAPNEQALSVRAAAPC